MAARRLLLALLLGLGAASARAADVPGVVPLPRKAFGPSLQALQADPATLTNFSGTVALAYLSGRATDGTGQALNLSADMRIFQGDYVATDATTQHGTFGFI